MPKRSSKPRDLNRLAAPTVGAALAAIILWLIPGDEPTAVALAFGVLCTFGSGWIVPETQETESV